MINTMGIIYTTKDDLTLREMTASRAVAALPVAGRYRMIDFVLSNMVNSGVRNAVSYTHLDVYKRQPHRRATPASAGRPWPTPACRRA